MRKLANQLKPFLFSLVIAIVLLFVQALADLNLPNYMSKLVNVGIQQGGIEQIAPEVMSKEGFELALHMMQEAEQIFVQSSYEQVDVADKNEAGEAYQSLYPRANESIFIKKERSKEDDERLHEIFGAASLTMIELWQGSDRNGDEPFNLASLHTLEKMINELQKNEIMVARERALMNEQLQEQSGVAVTKAFYEQLGVDLPAKQTNYILGIGLLMLVIALVGGVATVIVGFLSAKIATGVARNLRKQLFEKIESFSNEEIDRFSTASLITRCTNDVTQIQQLLSVGIKMMCYAPLIGIGGVIMAVKKSPSMSWIIAVAVITLVGMIVVIMTISMPKFKKVQSLIDKLNLVSRENLTGLMVVRSFGTRKHEVERFEQTNAELTKTNLFVHRVIVFMFPAMMFIMNGVTLLIVAVGARYIENAAIQVGDMLAFIQYAMQILMSFMMLSMVFMMLPRAAVSAGRISEVLETTITLCDPEHAKTFPETGEGVVEFRDVSFRYEGAKEAALHNISFVAKPGEMTALIGSTGSGKSTIAQLLVRFYDVSEGEIVIDGVDVRDVKQEALREKIGYVPQKAELLSGTIASNLQYGRKDATDEQLREAAEIAQALDFILEKREQFETKISQGGANVSGGQRQRLTIARALVKKPEILIFDDSFSALDFKTDAMLRKALKKVTKQTTMIVIAQRVSTIMDADQIIVLDKGRIVGKGTHQQLLKHCPEYIEIATSQLSKEELA